LTREEKIDLLTYHDEWPLKDYDDEDFDEEDYDEEDYDEDKVLSSDLAVGAPSEFYYFHHRNLEALRKAADGGCNFCYQIFYGLLETTILDRNVENTSQRLYLNLQTPGICAPEREHLYNGDLSVHLGATPLGNMRLKDLESG
jgi:hypothetical protein